MHKDMHFLYMCPYKCIEIQHTAIPKFAGKNKKNQRVTEITTA